MADWSAIYARSWSAKAAMENEANRLEEAARRLREQANELHRVLDPPEHTSEIEAPGCVECGAPLASPSEAVCGACVRAARQNI